MLRYENETKIKIKKIEINFLGYELKVKANYEKL